MKQSTRLIVNTGATYVRMAASVGLGLAYTRVTFALLGKEDFGLLGVLVSTIYVVFTLSESLNYASDRFLAYEIGRADAEKYRSVYATLQVLFLIVAIGGVAVSLVITWMMRSNPGQIPANRVGAACVALMLQAVAYAINVAGIPFRSALQSRQEIAFLTIFELSDAGLRLCAALGAGPLARYLHTDPLPTLVALMLVAMCVTVSGVAAMTLWRHPETRPNFARASWKEAKTVISFTGWSLVGGIASRVRVQGPQFLIYRVSPAANAAMVVAQQVAGYENNLGQAIMRAVTPALTTAEGRGDRPRVRQLIHAGNKFSLLMIILFLAPVSVELPQLLGLWLKPAPPPETANFARLIMLATAINIGTSGYLIALNAYGKIREFMIAMLISETSAIGIAAILVFALHFPSIAVPACTLAGVMSTTACLVWIVSGHLKLPKRDLIRLTWIPVLKSMLPALAICLIPAMLMQPSVVRMLVTGGAYIAVAVPLIWMFSLNAEEKHHLSRIAKGLRHRAGM